MRVWIRLVALGTAFSLAACSGASTDEHDAGAQVDMTSQDGAPVDAELLADMSIDSGSDAASSGCTSDEMCADPIRERCNTTTRACEGRPQWAITTIQYEDGEAVQSLDNIFSADATIQSAGNAYLRFQQGDGTTIWSMSIPSGTAAGAYAIEGSTSEDVWILLNASSSTLPATYRGYWDSISGTLTLSEASLMSGGRIRGTFEAVLERDDSAVPVQAILSADFFALFP